MTMRPAALVIGDHARLKSGGPVMLVVDHDLGGLVTVAWRTAGTIQEHTFPRICLERAPAPSGCRKRTK